MLDRNYEKIENNLVDWIRKKVSDAGCKGAVIGLSGGIDSSVTSLLCQKAFPENTLGIIMPCLSNPEDKVDAIKHAEKFGINYKEIDLSDLYQKFMQTIDSSDPEINLEEVKNNQNLA